MYWPHEQLMRLKKGRSAQEKKKEKPITVRIEPPPRSVLISVYGTAIHLLLHYVQFSSIPLECNQCWQTVIQQLYMVFALTYKIDIIHTPPQWLTGRYVIIGPLQPLGVLHLLTITYNYEKMVHQTLRD